MKIGAVYPQSESGGDPDTLEKIGLAVEAMGYNSLLTYDHVIGAVHEGRDPPLTGPYTERHSFHDPFTSFSYLAGMTRTIEFITGILILPQRQTVLVAKQAADLDLLSRERLTLGVGTGWNYVEYDALGEDFHKRGRKMDEQIPYLRRLWAEPLLSLDGLFDKLDRGGINPLPKRQIPIFCGGFGEAPYRRAVALADGFIFIGDNAFAGWVRIQELLKEAGRPIQGFGAHMIAQDLPAGHPLDVGGVIDKLNRWRDAGGTHASVGTTYRGYRTADEHIDFLAEVRERFGS